MKSNDESGTGLRGAWVERLHRPVDGAWLSAFRFLFGAALAISMGRFLAYGWVERLFVEPRFHFKYYGFSWVEPLSAAHMSVLFYALLGLSVCVCLGLLFRPAAILLVLGLSYVQLIDVSTYLNHYYLAALLSFLLACSPAARVASVDRWRIARRGSEGPPARSVPALWLYLFRFQVGLVYVCAGLAKANTDWLVHAQPLRIWLGTQTSLPLLGPLFTVEGVPLLMSWAGFLFDTTIVFWLSFRSTRPFAYLVLLTFHGLTRLLFPIGMFPVIMSIAALVFFEPTWPRSFLSRARAWLGRGGVERPKDSAQGARSGLEVPAPSALGRRALVGVWAVYCAVQLALPLRGLAYGGNVMWHEQGMRLSWRVMLRAKGGSTEFIVTEPASLRRAVVEPRRYLTDLQVAEMASQPDLILQMAHVIARDYEQRGWRDVRVQVDARVSLNGRRSAVLIDPKTDLTKEEDGLHRFKWVASAPSQIPHATRPVL
jgi:vitamin K-dependent gamma-carboxylase